MLHNSFIIIIIINRYILIHIIGMFQEFAMIHHQVELLEIMKAEDEMKHYSITVK